MSKNLISFSLWGSDFKYTIGALKNALSAKKVYPGWICRFYVDITVPIGIIFRLKEFDNVEVVEMNCVGDYRSMFWRFYPVSELDVDVVLVRDTDSRLNEREKSCVDDWLKGDKGIMTIFDHPRHNPYVLMPGLTGFKNGSYVQMRKKIDSFNQQDEYGIDYEFFNSIYSSIKNDLICYGKDVSIPHKRGDFEFCGQVFDENENTPISHLEELKRTI